MPHPGSKRSIRMDARLWSLASGCCLSVIPQRCGPVSSMRKPREHCPLRSAPVTWGRGKRHKKVALKRRLCLLTVLPLDLALGASCVEWLHLGGVSKHGCMRVTHTPQTR
jgi:hypothetical protein